MNKASGGDGIPVELFQILKDDAVKVLHSICQQIWKTQQWPLEKVSFHSSPKGRQCQITTNCRKFLKIWECQITWPASWEMCRQVKKQQSDLDMEQQTGSKSGKEYVKAVYCHPTCLTYMQSTSWEMLGWKKHRLESRLQREISVTSDM